MHVMPGKKKVSIATFTWSLKNSTCTAKVLFLQQLKQGGLKTATCLLKDEGINECSSFSVTVSAKLEFLIFLTDILTPHPLYK